MRFDPAARQCGMIIDIPIMHGTTTAAPVGCTRSALSANQGDVQDAIDHSVDGDVICIPAGTGIWTSSLVLTKAVHLRGSTAITVDSHGRATACPTIFQDNVTVAPYPMLNLQLVANRTTRLSNIQFNPGTRTSHSFDSGIIASGVTTDTRMLRIDHCVFNELWAAALGPNTTFGVIDHCTILCRNGFTAGVGFMKMNGYGGAIGSNTFGDGSWADAENFGTDKFIFWENCTISYQLGADANQRTLVDAQAGGRYVFRYCDIFRGSLEGHGLEASRERSTRCVEIYNNTFDGLNTQDTVTYHRGGVIVVHDNTVTNYTSGARLALLHNRENHPVTPWGNMDGTNVWDVNQGGGPFYTGTASSASSLVMTDSGKSFPSLVGYALKRTTNIGGLTGNDYSTVLSNSGTALTYESALQGGDLRFTVGDSYQIWHVLQGMDQPGRSGGSAVGGAASPSPPVGWNDQTTSPCYAWNNTRESGVAVNFSTQPNNPTVISGTHYINGVAKPGYTPYAYPHPLTL